MSDTQHENRISDLFRTLKKYLSGRFIHVVLMVLLLMAAFVMYSRSDVYMLHTRQMFSIGISFAALGTVLVLCLVYSLDQTLMDKSRVLFYGLMDLTYLSLYCYVLSWLAEGVPAWNWLNHTCNIIQLIITPIIALVFWYYQECLFSNHFQWHGLVSCMIIVSAVADIVYIIGSAWSRYLYTIDRFGCFQWGEGYRYTLICPTFILGICVYVNMKRRISFQKRISMLIFCVTPVATEIITALVNEYAYTYVIVSYILVLIYGTIQRERNLELAEKKKELADKQVQLMISQINPHFMYNTLGTIRSLCHTDPVLAAYTVNQFALYLRGNMDMMMQIDPIMIELEMRHVRYFTQIERMRFPNISVQYDLQDMEFMVPALTVQPLVENAIRYGVRSKRDGMVWISTWQDENNHYIVVKDNGVGFDPAIIPNNEERSHIGIANVRNRLEQMIDGRMKIDSVIGEGTTVTITIPIPDFDE